MNLQARIRFLNLECMILKFCVDLDYVIDSISNTLSLSVFTSFGSYVFMTAKKLAESYM